MKAVNLPIFFHSDYTNKANDLDINYSLDECEQRQMTFLVINAISPYKEDGKEYTAIFSNGNEFISPLKIDDVIMRINSVFC